MVYFVIIIIFWRLFLVPVSDWAVFDFYTSCLFFNWYVLMYMPIPFIFPDSYLCYLHPLVSCKDKENWIINSQVIQVDTLYCKCVFFCFTGSVELTADAYLSIKLLRCNWITAVCVVNRSQVISGSVHKESFPLTGKPTSN